MDWLEAALDRVKRLPKAHKLRREQCVESLWVFAQTMNPQYCYGDIHRDIFIQLQDYKLYETEAGANTLIMLPRAHLKSHIVATFCAWIIVRHPEISILYLSATSKLAETQLRAIKNLMESDAFQHYFPEWIHPSEGKREIWNNQEIAIDHPARGKSGQRDATVATAGLTTNTTGWHADVILSDDIVVPGNAYTAAGRKEVSDKVSQFTSIRNNGGFTLAAGTRYHPDDIYATFKEQTYPIYDENDLLSGYAPVWNIVEHEVETNGVFLWPRTQGKDGKAYGFDLRTLARIEAEYEDKVQFQAQYYNNPNAAGSERINRDLFKYGNRRLIGRKNGAWHYGDRRLNIMAAMDFAYTENRQSDYTAIAVVGLDCYGYYYILDLHRFRTDKVQVMYDELMEIWDRWQFRTLRAEVTAAQSIIVKDIRAKIQENGGVLTVKDYLPTRKEGSKTERIAATLEPRYEEGLIIHFNDGLTQVYEEEAIQARPRHDDLKDVVTSAIQDLRRPAIPMMEADTSNVAYGKFGGVKFR